MTEEGTIVKVYKDPVTRKKEEGDAVLIEKLKVDEYTGLTLCNVSFIGDECLVQRWIKEQE